ncbi:MAG: hypothetical protein RJQ09_04150 [Cyclobacteriaceae bacterium]
MRIIGIVLATMISICSIAADVTIQSKNYKNDVEVGLTNFYFKGDQLMIENQYKTDNNTLIFNAANKQFTFIDHKRKEYYQATETELKRFIGQLRQLVQVTKAFMKSMPPEQQEAITKSLDKYLNADSQPVTNFAKSKSGVKVGKWSTDQYNATQGDAKVAEMYIASHSAAGVSKDDFKTFEVMSQVFSQTIAEFVAVLPLGASVQSMASNLDQNPAFSEGIAVKSISYIDGNVDGENRVDSITTGDVSASKFAVPSGYAKKELEMPKMK